MGGREICYTPWLSFSFLVSLCLWIMNFTSVSHFSFFPFGRSRWPDWAGVGYFLFPRSVSSSQNPSKIDSDKITFLEGSPCLEKQNALVYDNIVPVPLSLQNQEDIFLWYSLRESGWALVRQNTGVVRTPYVWVPLEFLFLRFI